MKQIKFRGKRKDNNQIIYGDLCIYDIIYFIGIAKTIFELRKNVFVPNVIWYEVEPESVGQFTGLEDKQGKEIYEGDIFDSPSKNKFYVIWFKDGWFIQNVKDKGIHPIQRLSEIASYWKVIGNVYENQELLK